MLAATMNVKMGGFRRGRVAVDAGHSCVGRVGNVGTMRMLLLDGRLQVCQLLEVRVVSAGVSFASVPRQ